MGLDVCGGQISELTGWHHTGRLYTCLRSDIDMPIKQKCR